MKPPQLLDADKVLKEVLLTERGIEATTSIATLSSKSSQNQPTIKTEPTFAIDSRKSRRQSSRGVNKNKNKQNKNCWSCGNPWSTTHICTTKGVECRLCKRKGHFSKYCQNAKEAVTGSIKEEDNMSIASSAHSEHNQEQQETNEPQNRYVSIGHTGFISNEAYDDEEVGILSIECDNVISLPQDPTTTYNSPV